MKNTVLCLVAACLLAVAATAQEEPRPGASEVIGVVAAAETKLIVRRSAVGSKVTVADFLSIQIEDGTVVTARCLSATVKACQSAAIGSGAVGVLSGEQPGGWVTLAITSTSEDGG